jgi:hypothetical protein
MTIDAIYEAADYVSLVANLPDAALIASLAGINRPVRDGQGNLRELTADETLFLAAAKAERRRRGV